MVWRGLLATLLMAGAALPIQAQSVIQDFSAKSSMHVETTGEGEVKTKVENAQFVPYVFFVGGDQRARLATITTTIEATNRAEGYGPGTKVAITVDDLTVKPARRLASFSDPGSRGEIVGDFSAATMFGCCDGADDHRVRYLETGKLLFSATGPGPMGTNGWVDAPNSHPYIRRWAALNCDVEEAEVKAGVLCRLAYGSDAGELSAVTLTSTPGPDREDLWRFLVHGAAAVQWVDAKPDKARQDVTGEATAPMSIWAVNNITDPKQMSGFKLRLTLEKKQMALIPIVADRLTLTHAVSAPGITLAAARTP